MNKAVVNDIIHSTIAAFHDEGLQVFQHLENAVKSNTPVEVSFEGIERCATQFLNAAIGKLYMEYDKAILDALLRYNYAGLPHLKDKIEEVITNALDSKEYDCLVDEATR